MVACFHDVSERYASKKDQLTSVCFVWGFFMGKKKMALFLSTVVTGLLVLSVND